MTRSPAPAGEFARLGSVAHPAPGPDAVSIAVPRRKETVDQAVRTRAEARPARPVSSTVSGHALSEKGNPSNRVSAAAWFLDGARAAGHACSRAPLRPLRRRTTAGSPSPPRAWTPPGPSSTTSGIRPRSAGHRLPAASAIGLRTRTAGRLVAACAAGAAMPSCCPPDGPSYIGNESQPPAGPAGQDPKTAIAGLADETRDSQCGRNRRLRRSVLRKLDFWAVDIQPQAEVEGPLQAQPRQPVHRSGLDCGRGL